MTFYLGTHKAVWLERLEVPLFISRRTLVQKKKLKPAACRWALDSGGFSELSMHGRWDTTPRRYAREVRVWYDEIGGMDWASQQDWMCEPVMLEKTGRDVAYHQRATLENYLELNEIDCTLPWAPVLQGWEPEDYLRHADAFHDAGVPLDRMPVVGVGTMCRRQAMDAAETTLRRLAGRGYRLHAFGLKTLGLVRSADVLQSSDSMAWSLRARKRPPLPGHTHKTCSNCPEYALLWREQVLDAVRRRRGGQLLLPL